MNPILGYLSMYAAYLLGASLFVLDVIEKYQMLADASPDPNITYKKKSFWQKERISIIRIFLLGIASIIIVPLFFGNGNMQFTNGEGAVTVSIPAKLALIPLQIVIGYSGGRAILAVFGKTKKELYAKLGITETKDN